MRPPSLQDLYHPHYFDKNLEHQLKSYKTSLNFICNRARSKSLSSNMKIALTTIIKRVTPSLPKIVSWSFHDEFGQLLWCKMMHQVEVEGSNISLSSKGNKRMFTDWYLSNTKYSPTRLATLLSYVDVKLSILVKELKSYVNWKASFLLHHPV